MCFKIEVIFVAIRDEYQFNHDVTSALGDEVSFIEAEHFLVDNTHEDIGTLRLFSVI